MFADARQVAKRPHEYLLATRERYGPVAQLPIPSPPTYLVSDPHLVRQVLQVRPRLYDKDTIQYRALALVTGQGLLAVTDGPWRQQRPAVQPAFHASALQRVVEDTLAACDRLVGAWSAAPPGSVVDADEAMMRLGMEVVGQHLFGADLVETAPRLTRATLEALDAVVSAARPPWSLLPDSINPAAARFDEALSRLDSAVVDLVAQRLMRGSGGRESDLMELLLLTYPLDPAPDPARADSVATSLSSPQGRVIRDQIITFLVAGHETVASALTWALGLLSTHPLRWIELVAEVDAVLQGRPPSAADLPRLRYTRAVVDEALRLYPPAWIITRTSEDDSVLGNRFIPRGALVITSPWVLHHDPAVWPDPEAFDPGRFMPDDDAAAGSVARAATAHSRYIPFGTGMRLCIGRDMALVESVVVLATIGQNFDLMRAAFTLPEIDPLVTLRPADGLRVRVRRRPLWR